MTTEWTIQHGSEYMKMDAAGRISRPAIGMASSGRWQVIGAVRFNNFGRIVERFTLDDVKAGGIDWRYKNGKQRVHVCDCDHGTERVWMSPTHSIR